VAEIGLLQGPAETAHLGDLEAVLKGGWQKGALSVAAENVRPGRAQRDQLLAGNGQEGIAQALADAETVSERQDTQRLTVLCKVLERRGTLYPGQRVTARLPLAEGFRGVLVTPSQAR
jgi:hypothetical protein